MVGIHQFLSPIFVWKRTHVRPSGPDIVMRGMACMAALPFLRLCSAHGHRMNVEVGAPVLSTMTTMMILSISYNCIKFVLCGSHRRGSRYPCVTTRLMAAQSYLRLCAPSLDTSMRQRMHAENTRVQTVSPMHEAVFYARRTSPPALRNRLLVAGG